MQTSKQPFHWPTAFQFGLSTLAILFLWGVAATMFLLGITQFFQGISLQTADATAFLMAAGFTLLGNLIVPSAWFSLARLVRLPDITPAWINWKNFRRAIWLFPLVLLAGYGVARVPAIAWLVLPIFHVLAIGLPIVWLLSLGARGLKGSSPQTAWGILAAGLALGPLIIIVFELLAGFVVLVLVVLLLSQQPGFQQDMAQLLNMLDTSGPPPSPERLLPILEPYFTQPWVILVGLGFIAGFVPFLEELFKPIGLLFMNGKNLTPARGFLAGMLSGAAFALFESLLQAAQGEEWIILAVGRSGTSLVHIFNSGLVGWGIALAWKERRYLRLVLHYLAAVLIHALWNGFSILLAVSTLPDQGNFLTDFPWERIAAVGLPVLGVVAFAGLIASSRGLRQAETPLQTGSGPAIIPGPVGVESQDAGDSPEAGTLPPPGNGPQPGPEKI